MDTAPGGGAPRPLASPSQAWLWIVPILTAFVGAIAVIAASTGSNGIVAAALIFGAGAFGIGRASVSRRAPVASVPSQAYAPPPQAYAPSPMAPTPASVLYAPPPPARAAPMQQWAPPPAWSPAYTPAPRPPWQVPAPVTAPPRASRAPRPSLRVFALQDRRVGVDRIGAYAIIGISVCVALLTTLVQMTGPGDTSVYTAWLLIEGITCVGVAIVLRLRILAVIGGGAVLAVALRALVTAFENVPLYAVFGVAAVLLMVLATVLATQRARIHDARESLRAEWGKWD